MKSIVLSVLVAIVPVAASAADFAGTWKVAYVGERLNGPKSIGSMIFDFKIDEGKVTGLAHIGLWPGLAPIAEGKVDGDQISFIATGHLTSTTGIPTCRFEGTISGGELVIKLSTIRNPGGPGSGGIYEYRGGRLDRDAARDEKLKALRVLSWRGFPDVEPPSPNDFDATLKARTPRLTADITAWEKVKPSQSAAESFSDQDLDDLIAFYNSSAGQSMIKAETPVVETAVASFLDRH